MKYPIALRAGLIDVGTAVMAAKKTNMKAKPTTKYPMVIPQPGRCDLGRFIWLLNHVNSAPHIADKTIKVMIPV